MHSDNIVKYLQANIVSKAVPTACSHGFTANAEFNALKCSSLFYCICKPFVIVYHVVFRYVVDISCIKEQCVFS